MKSTLHFTNFHATRWALAPLAGLGLTLSF
jgi:hypothetical protein